MTSRHGEQGQAGSCWPSSACSGTPPPCAPLGCRRGGGTGGRPTLRALLTSLCTPPPCASLRFSALCPYDYLLCIVPFLLLGALYAKGPIYFRLQYPRRHTHRSLYSAPYETGSGFGRAVGLAAVPNQHYIIVLIINALVLLFVSSSADTNTAHAGKVSQCVHVRSSTYTGPLFSSQQVVD